MHTQTTSTPILSSNSRDLSYNARRLSYQRTCPAEVFPILQIPTILQVLLQTVHPILSLISRDLSYNARHLSYERTCPAEVFPILQIPTILQILLQTVHPILSLISRDLSYNARHLSYERTCPAGVSPILQILIQTNHPILSSNARDLSQNTHTSTRLFATPLPSRKSPRIPQILLQTTKQIRPPSTAPPPTIPPFPHVQYRVQAVQLSTIHYPLSPAVPPCHPPLTLLSCPHPIHHGSSRPIRGTTWRT